MLLRSSHASELQPLTHPENRRRSVDSRSVIADSDSSNKLLRGKCGMGSGASDLSGPVQEDAMKALPDRSMVCAHLLPYRQ